MLNKLDKLENEIIFNQNKKEKVKDFKDVQKSGNVAINVSVMERDILKALTKHGISDALRVITDYQMDTLNNENLTLDEKKQVLDVLHEIEKSYGIR